MTESHLETAHRDFLVGRDRELESLRLFLDETAGHGGAMLLSGEAGAGKTTLLDRAVVLARERGMAVLRCQGAKSAEEAPFRALRRLLIPLGESAANVPEQHRRVLDVAFGYRDGEPPEIQRVAQAALAMVQSTKAGTGLLIAIDNLHRVDLASRQALCLLAAQLSGTGIRMLCVVRPDSGVADGFGFPVCHVGPLDDDASRALLDRRFPSLAARVRRHILAEARGIPLALTELPLSLTPTQWKAAVALPTVLPLTERLQTVYGPQVSALPPETRKLLLAAAFEGTGDLTVLKAVAETDLETALRHAEDAQLAGIDPTRNRLVFRHPLARATVVALASPSQRREAHHRLADALAGRTGPHAWHLSQSAITANDSTADLVHDAAMQAMMRGAGVNAVRLMTRSADLSAEPRLRARRLGYAAAMSADLAGDFEAASRLLQDARENDPDFDGTLPATVAVATTLLNSDGDVEAAYGLLVTALESEDGTDGGRTIPLRMALWTLARVCWLGGRAELWMSLLRLAEKYREHLTEFELATWRTAADPARVSAADLAVIDREITSARTENDLIKIVRLSGACTAVDRTGEMRAALWRVVESGRNGELIMFAVHALTHLCRDALARGRWSDVDLLGGEALRLCEENGQQLGSWVARGNIAAVAALRGDTETTGLLTRGMIAWAVPRDARVVLHLAVHARMLEALGAADFESAYQYAAEIGLPGLLEPSSPPQMHMSFDLVEAAVHTDRHREAEAHVRAVEATRTPSLSPRLALRSAAAAALVAPRDRASRCYERALSLPGVARWPYDRARVQLAYGEHLRRLRATGEAQRQLRSALTTFRDLGATPWAARAEVELRAAGDRGVVAEPADGATLTPQELAIVRLAAGGLTNKQIARRLHLSPRTVGNHLYRAFPKLGISSRASLRDALNSHRLDPEEGVTPPAQRSSDALSPSNRATGRPSAFSEHAGKPGRQSARNRR